MRVYMSSIVKPDNRVRIGAMVQGAVVMDLLMHFLRNFPQKSLD